jgi:AAA domain
MFQPIYRSKGFLRMGLFGGAGSGKTVTALYIARQLAGRNGVVSVLDTESEVDLYASDEEGTIEGVTKFYADQIDKADPRKLPQYLNNAAKVDTKVLIIDSYTNFWNGDGGSHSLVAAWGERNTKQSWNKINNIEALYQQALRSAPFHVICLMREKVDKVEGKRQGEYPREVVRFDHRANADYPLNLLARMGENFQVIVEKVRCHDRDIPLMGGVFSGDGKEFAELVLKWLGRGSEIMSPKERRDQIMESAKKAYGERDPGRLLQIYRDVEVLVLPDEMRAEMLAQIQAWGVELRGNPPAGPLADSHGSDEVDGA